MHANKRYINSTRGASSKKDASQWHTYLTFQAHSATLTDVYLMCVFVYLCVEPVSRSKDYAWSWIKIGSILCLCKPVTECAWNVGYICHWGASFSEDGPLVEFMYLVFTRMPSESYHRQLRSLLLYMCYAFQVLINSHVCWVMPRLDNHYTRATTLIDGLKHIAQYYVITINPFNWVHADCTTYYDHQPS